MLRCTIELLPGGDESRARTIGLVEIANIGGTAEVGNYSVVLKKTPPFAGALRAAWKSGKFTSGEDDEVIAGSVEGHHRTKRGSYDLLYRALKACGLEGRIPAERR
jgi:hypothetical protein